jgi:hypothetical protein
VLLKRLQAVSCGSIPFFTSDQLPHYAHALLHVYGIPEVILHIPGKRSPKPTPKRFPLRTCTMPRSSSAGKGDAWWKEPPRSSSARKRRCKRAELRPRSVRPSIPVSSNATT